MAGGYLIVELLFRSKLFSTFLTLTPAVLQSQFPSEPFMSRFKARSTDDLYDAWDMAFLYVLLLAVTFSAMAGFWLFLLLRLFGAYDLGIGWLAAWFILLLVIYAKSASDQYAFELKARHKKAGIAVIKKYMLRDQANTLKRWGFYFVLNWVKAPITALQVLLIACLFVWLHWPLWVVRAITKTRVDMQDENQRRYYYVGYALLFQGLGLVFRFLFS